LRRIPAAIVLSGLVLRVGPLLAQRPGLHPDPRYIEAPIPPSFTIAVTAGAAALPFSLAPRPTAAFGSESDSAGVAIGEITAALILPTGDVVLLDGKESTLRFFAAAGRPKQRFGRAGRGPGEFFHPLSLAVDRTGRLFVADLAHAVQVFAPSPAGYRYERTLHIEVAAHGMCFLDTLLVVQGMKLGEDPIFRVYDSAGRPVRAFGSLYRSPNAILNYLFPDGHITCDSRRGLVFYAPSSVIGEVRAYRVDGTAAWRTVLAGYKVNRVEDVEQGYRVVTGPEVHSVQALTLMPGRGLLLQVAMRTSQALRERLPYTNLRSFLLDVATGRPPLGDRLPPILAAGEGDVVLAFEDPVPRFEVRRLVRP
jgi:hypothetical protein